MPVHRQVWEPRSRVEPCSQRGLSHRLATEASIVNAGLRPLNPCDFTLQPLLAPRGVSPPRSVPPGHQEGARA